MRAGFSRALQDRGPKARHSFCTAGPIFSQLLTGGDIHCRLFEALTWKTSPVLQQSLIADTNERVEAFDYHWSRAPTWISLGGKVQ